MPTRRALLCAAAAALALPVRVRAAVPRVAIAGAGWAGLAALHTLRQALPEAELTLVDREPQFRALPLSNAWLAGLAPERLPRIDLAAHAAARGARFVHAALDAIDRERRELRAGTQRWSWDALLLATGAEGDFRAWFGDDAAAAALARRRWSAGFAAAELDGLRRRLDSFTGGTLLMTVPPPPLRCPPAPYERALLLSHWMQRRGVKGRIVLLDAGAGMPRLNRLIAERHAGRIDHRLHVVVQSVDPAAQRIDSTEGELRWDEALLLPPMHAGALLRDAGLTRGARFAAVDPDALRSPLDDRIWLAGDALDSVSPLFGAYPKTAEIAADTGAAAALQIAATLQGRDAGPAPLPRSRCHLWLQAEPPEQLVLEAQFRRRGDGVVTQALRQTDNPQPRGEDLAWARELLATRLGLGGGS
ncbi:MAG: FAD-dependent oxidoreductase [Rubrivivax sp.]